MQSGVLNKVAIRPGNETGAKILKHVCPKQGAVYGDKGFCDGEAVKTKRPLALWNTFSL